MPNSILSGNLQSAGVEKIKILNPTVNKVTDLPKTVQQCPKGQYLAGGKCVPFDNSLLNKVISSQPALPALPDLPEISGGNDTAGGSTQSETATEPWYKKYLWLEIAALLVVLGLFLFFVLKKK